MNKEYVFKDSKNAFWVVGNKECFLTKETISDIGFIRVSKQGNCFLSLNGVKQSKRFNVKLEQYFQFFVTSKPNKDFILVDFKLPTMINGDSISVFDVDRIERKYPSETVDKTRFAGRESLDDNALIGSPDFNRIERLDSPISSVDEAAFLLDEIKNSKVVVDNVNLIDNRISEVNGDDE